DALPIYLFGGVYTGLAMPQAWQGAMTWDAPSSNVFVRMWREMVSASSAWDPGSWGGHAVPLLRYDADGYTPITWGSSSYRITNTGLSTYCDELYAIVTTDFISKAGVDPQGFNLAQLTADLQQVSA